MSDSALTLGPAWMYPLKAALTRARSLGWLARTRGGAAAAAGIRILFYHRVAAERDELSVQPRAFTAQMEHLRAEGYRVVDVLEAAALLDAPPSPHRVVGLSFDDGYADIARHALPVLERLGFRASVFVATGTIDGAAPLTWYRTPPPLLSWPDIARLDADSAFSFEAHTVTHPNLMALSDDAARAEISGSRDQLEDRLGRAVHGFCYPAGLLGRRERDLVAGAGFDVATTCEPGVNTAATDRLALRRMQIDARDGAVDFRAKLAGAHDRPPAARQLYRRLRRPASAAS